MRTASNIGLADTTSLRGGHYRRLGDQQSAVGDPPGQAGAEGTRAFDDDQRRLLVDPAGDPGASTVEARWRVGEHGLIDDAVFVALISANEWVAAWVSTPMTNAYCSATMGMATLISFQ
jgi:hypothetical protein